MKKTDRKLQRALELHQAGQLAEAGALYREILQKDPGHVDALNLLGVILQSAGDLEAAIILLTRATEGAPDYAVPFVNLGNALQLAGRLEDAVDAFQKAITLAPEQAEATSNLASALNELGRHEEALDACVASLMLRPDLGPTHNNMGNALQGLGDAEQAIASYGKAIEINPGDATAHYNLGNAHSALHRVEDAYKSYKKAVALDDRNAEKLYNLGLAAMAMDHLEEARLAFTRAITIDPQFIDAHANLGNLLQALEETEDAVGSLRRALMLDQVSGAGGDGSPDIHWNLALALIQNGDLEEGFEEYAWRWQTPAFDGFRREFPKPPWQGEDLSGKTVFTFMEQGFGDSLMFCRFAPLLAARGASVIVECRAQLTQLMETLDGVGRCIDRGTSVAPEEYDFYVPLMDLPAIMGTTLGTVPADVPYLSVPENREPHPHIAEATGLKVGIAWAGSATRVDDHKRSCPLTVLKPLLDIPGTCFFSLQVGDSEAQLSELDDARSVVNLADGLADFADTAAAMSELDLIITVDTAVLHLAGALGKPVWGLLAKPTGFFWMCERDDSPWYPTAQLFRQPQAGDWKTPVAAMAAALKEIAEKG